METLTRTTDHLPDSCDPCAFQRVAQVEFRNLADDLRELKDRVHDLERTIARGVMLLIANLAGLIVAIARELL
jgi:hypothetical protein